MVTYLGFFFDSDTFCSDKTPLWEDLFSFFALHPPPIKTIQAATAWVRVTCFLINNRNVEFSLFIKNRKDIVKNIVDHIGKFQATNTIVAVVIVTIMLTLLPTLILIIIITIQ